MNRFAGKSKSLPRLSRLGRFKRWAKARRELRQYAPARARFYTWYVWEKEMHDVRGYFLGHAPPVFYSFHIETTQVAYSRAVWRAVTNRSYELAPNRDVSILDLSYLKPARGEPGSLIWKPPARLRYPELDNLRRFDWIKRESRRLTDARTVKIRESTGVVVEADGKFRVFAVVHQPEIAIEFLNRWIRCFLWHPRNWRGREEHSFTHAELERSWRRKRASNQRSESPNRATMDS